MDKEHNKHQLNEVSKYQHTQSKMLSFPEVVRIHPYIKFKAFPPLRAKENPHNLACFKVKMVTKRGKSMYLDQNLISFEGGQDMSTSQISGHSSHTLSRKYPKIANLTCFTMSECYRNEKNQLKIMKQESKEKESDRKKIRKATWNSKILKNKSKDRDSNFLVVFSFSKA